MTAAASLRVVAAVRSGAHLVARPRGVVHLAPADSPLTPSGAALRRDARTVCRGRTGRLYLFASGVCGVQSSGRRFCRRCTAALPFSLGTEVAELRTRDDDLTAYGHLTVDDFTVAASWCRSVAETHQVGRIASVVLGPTPVRGHLAEPGSIEHALWVFEQTLLKRRKNLTTRELTPEQREARAAEAEARQFQADRIDSARRSAAQLARAVDRRARDRFQMPWERSLLDSA